MHIFGSIANQSNEICDRLLSPREAEYRCEAHHGDDHAFGISNGKSQTGTAARCGLYEQFSGLLVGRILNRAQLIAHENADDSICDLQFYFGFLKLFNNSISAHFFGQFINRLISCLGLKLFN